MVWCESLAPARWLRAVRRPSGTDGVIDGWTASAVAAPAERPGRRPDAARHRAPAQPAAETAGGLGAGLGGDPGRGRVAARRLPGHGRDQASPGQTPDRAGVRLRGGACLWAV